MPQGERVSKRSVSFLGCSARVRKRNFCARGGRGYFLNGDHAGLGNELDSIACLETGATKYAPRNDDLILCFCGHDQ